MKALTIWQPWASLIVAGAKPYEFRGWRPPQSIIGQRIVIHAAARKIDWREVDQLRRLLEAGGHYAASTCLHADAALPILRDAASLPIAAGLGTAIVGEPIIGTKIAEGFGLPAVNDSDLFIHANWGWPMEAIEPFAEPIACKGAQGLWTWFDAAGAAVA